MMIVVHMEIEWISAATDAAFARQKARATRRVRRGRAVVSADARVTRAEFTPVYLRVEKPDILQL